FGFASSAGLPQLSESLISGLPLHLSLISDDGSRRVEAYGRIVGYSNRFNTILVPKAMLDYYNDALAPASEKSASRNSKKALQNDEGGKPSSRLIVDVNSPGDAAIASYLEEKGWEVAGDKNASSAAYMLRVVSGVIIGVGSIITLLSLLILGLSMSLLMEKNRRKLHSLLMLGTHITDVARPYWRLTAFSALAAGLLAWLSVFFLRRYYLEPLRAIGADGASMLWPTILIVLLTLIIIYINCRSITRRVLTSWTR
ncbi:MAG: ABC transporter permease, partial [Muribaculaceae bacterium]|nr:ABC transporter permease [Muribaculaceae bacterium]